MLRYYGNLLLAAGFLQRQAQAHFNNSYPSELTQVLISRKLESFEAPCFSWDAVLQPMLQQQQLRFSHGYVWTSG
jgi:hypothetical protein